jgi:hypothetical protein
MITVICSRVTELLNNTTEHSSSYKADGRPSIQQIPDFMQCEILLPYPTPDFATVPYGNQMNPASISHAVSFIRYR